MRVCAGRKIVRHKKSLGTFTLASTIIEFGSCIWDLIPRFYGWASKKLAPKKRPSKIHLWRLGNCAEPACRKDVKTLFAVLNGEQKNATVKTYLTVEVFDFDPDGKHVLMSWHDKLVPLLKEASDSKKPPPPESLVEALQDRACEEDASERKVSVYGITRDR